MVASPKGFWTKQTGETITIASMNDRHLRNAINMMVRNRRTASSKYQELIEETQKRGWKIDPLDEEDDFRFTGAL